jgi:hypothetical protein
LYSLVGQLLSEIVRSVIVQDLGAALVGWFRDKCLVVRTEKQNEWWPSCWVLYTLGTARSAGTTWVPNNRSARRTDVAAKDSRVEGLIKMHALAVLFEPSAVLLIPETACLFAKVQDDSE